MKMTERQLIQEILNTVDVLYDFENVDEDTKEYTLLIKQQNNDPRSLQVINDEMKHYFKEAAFTYQEQLQPADLDCDIKVEIKR
ncbi:hypothetical protein B808_841 [Fructilactobacillus florum 8D]|uniref:Uncharacterized protein n=2 Tax=Fructilactobacillus florum TaxID=640331 RepID=W9EG50_9LACO|nr:hypothetical protein [Fructilactobacillus florum]EKK21085.1 hypothetical protein B807_126 [Fructilactobacillus florum 2F]ETO40246.1 hypothetical protein B808_841 [Fructilactobacillus florum 8D]KRM90199.1 hypothetical protein FC87_GL001278 [Fructilactobacillus florum DSM 22689 = JCM 16035]